MVNTIKKKIIYYGFWKVNILYIYIYINPTTADQRL